MAYNLYMLCRRGLFSGRRGIILCTCRRDLCTGRRGITPRRRRGLFGNMWGLLNPLPRQAFDPDMEIQKGHNTFCMH
jgi:hypothetical protein